MDYEDNSIQRLYKPAKVAKLEDACLRVQQQILRLRIKYRGKGTLLVNINT